MDEGKVPGRVEKKAEEKALSVRPFAVQAPSLVPHGSFLPWTFQSLIFDEVDLSDASVAETSTKNINNSFTVGLDALGDIPDIFLALSLLSLIHI